MPPGGRVLGMSDWGGNPDLNTLEGLHMPASQGSLPDAWGRDCGGRTAATAASATAAAMMNG